VKAATQDVKKGRFCLLLKVFKTQQQFWGESERGITKLDKEKNQYIRGKNGSTGHSKGNK
jgi:hypothetical protein